MGNDNGAGSLFLEFVDKVLVPTSILICSFNVEEIIMPNVEVSCTISNCTFHAKGNICGANKITIDMGNESKYDTEFSQEFDFKSRTEAAR